MTNKEKEREGERKNEKGERERERIRRQRERELKRLVVQTSESFCFYDNILIVISLWTLFYPIIIIIMRHFMLPCWLTNIRKGFLTNNNSLVQCNCRSCHNKK